MCRSSKKLRGSMPRFKAKTIPLDAKQSEVNLAPKSTSFNGWVNVATLEKGNRAAIPFNFYKHFNEQNLKKPLAGISISKRKKGWFLSLIFEVLEPPECSRKRIGIDVGYKIAAATSTGEMHGNELEFLQRRTKRRRYVCDAKKPYRQGLNRIAKNIEADHTRSDFSVERINLKGKRGISKNLRTILSQFAYQHLAHRLERLGQAKGFRVIYVNPAYTSQRCPQCGCVDKSNRNGDLFKCVSCGHSAHADVNAAININGGEAVVNYDKPVLPGLLAYPLQEYPGTVCALTNKP